MQYYGNMIRKKKKTLLELIENHIILKWIFFIAAFIWAITVIINLPIKFYEISKDIISGDKNINFLNKIEIWDNIQYINENLWQAKKIINCEDTEYYKKEEICLWINNALKKYRFDNENYFLDIITNKSNLIEGFTISGKTTNFNPEFQLFLWRFVWQQTLKLGKTNFSNFDQFNKDEISIIENYYVGNIWWGYFNLIYSSDYAVENLIILKTYLDSPISNNYIDNKCDYSLLSKYNYLNGDLSDLDTTKLEKNINKFKNRCAIQSLSIVNKEAVGIDFFKLNENELEENLKKLSKNFY